MLTFSEVHAHAILKSPKLLLFITFLIVHEYQCKKLSFMQGQEVKMNFPYPCDSTEVTLQYENTSPFYQMTEGSLPSPPQEPVNRFKVLNNSENSNCSLDLKISNVMKTDAGSYISHYFKDGNQVDFTKIELVIDYPPGTASCVIDKEMDGNWVSIQCTASSGSVPGKINCFQNGEIMPSLGSPNETSRAFTETILAHRSQPLFCCTSTLSGYKGRCECNDTTLFAVDGSSRNPCPITPTIPTKSVINNITRDEETGPSESELFSTVAFKTSNTTECNVSQNDSVPLILQSMMPIILIPFVCFGILFLGCVFCCPHFLRSIITKNSAINKNTTDEETFDKMAKIKCRAEGFFIFFNSIFYPYFISQVLYIFLLGVLSSYLSHFLSLVFSIILFFFIFLLLHFICTW